MSTRVQLTFDCADPVGQARFWAEALHYREQEPPAGFAAWDDWAKAQGFYAEGWKTWAAIVDPDEAGPRVFFQKVPEPKTAKNRMHMDLNVSGRGASLEQKRAEVDAEVVRLKALGASDHRGAITEDDEYWVRMNDPEGNEFCVQ